MALLRDPVTREEILAQEAQMRARETTASLRSLIAPEAGYEYGQAVPLRTRTGVIGRTRSGQPIRGQQIQPTVPLALREGASSLLNLAEGTQTGVVNPEDVLNVMPMGAAASLLDEGIDGGFATGMFIGRSNLRANPQAFEMADEMAAAGRRSEDIFRETYRETGDPVFVGRDSQLRQEISDVGEVDASELARAAKATYEDQDSSAKEFNLESFVSPEYAQAFSRRDQQAEAGAMGAPTIQIMGFREGASVKAPSASYSPRTNTVRLNPVHRDPISLEMRPATEDELRSSLLHELQHKVQGSDRLATGSNEALARDEYYQTLDFLSDSDAYRKINERAEEINRYRPRFKDVSNADTAKYYDELSRRENVGQVARKIFNNAEWYRVGDDIVNELGPAPKRSGEARNEWLRQAATRLSNVFANQVEDKSLLDLDRNQLKSEYRKMYRKSFPQDSYETATAQRFIREYVDELGRETSPYTLYRRKLGETEARATQTRENMTLEQRANVFPERSYDINPAGTIVDQDLLQDTPQGLLNLTRQTR